MQKALTKFEMQTALTKLERLLKDSMWYGDTIEIHLKLDTDIADSTIDKAIRMSNIIGTYTHIEFFNNLPLTVGRCTFESLQTIFRNYKQYVDEEFKIIKTLKECIRPGTSEKLNRLEFEQKKQYLKIFDVFDNIQRQIYGAKEKIKEQYIELLSSKPEFAVPYAWKALTLVNYFHPLEYANKEGMMYATTCILMWRLGLAPGILPDDKDKDLLVKEGFIDEIKRLDINKFVFLDGTTDPLQEILSKIPSAEDLDDEADVDPMMENDDKNIEEFAKSIHTTGAAYRRYEADQSQADVKDKTSPIQKMLDLLESYSDSDDEADFSGMTETTRRTFQV
jgi:hypothetical protein